MERVGKPEVVGLTLQPPEIEPGSNECEQIVAKWRLRCQGTETAFETNHLTSCTILVELLSCRIGVLPAELGL